MSASPVRLTGAQTLRPEVLFPLFASIETLPGVGPKTKKAFEALTGPQVVDLCWHLPSGVIDRRYSPKLAEATPGRIATIKLEVVQHRPPSDRRRPYRILCRDETGTIELVYFHARRDYLTGLLPEGETRVVSGKVERFQDQLQMAHPDHVVRAGQAASLAVVEPVYPMTAALAANTLTKAIRAALQQVPELPEWLDAGLLAKRGWPAWHRALRDAHRPEDEQDLAPTTPARLRLAYDELLANQLALALVRLRLRRMRGRAVQGDGRLREKVLQALPFALTGAQERSIEEILSDMAAPHRMLRLLQGDVGSGKTLVALMAMLAAVESGAQAALMAPTEILARQHHATIQPLAAAAGVDCVVLTGRDKGKARREMLARIAEGQVPLVIGTHALFQSDVAFRDLALAVVDEQHRFGVHQRLTLQAKGQGTDVLVMTATPIPRTLMLTAYGDMEVSRLDEKPAGRKPIDTRVVSAERIEAVIGAIERSLKAGNKAYWVCPLVEESETSDLAAAEARAEALQERFPGRVGLVHGRMKGPEKDAVMEAFKNGGLDLLVATTVIEVGVDVSQASVMVIEHAERFGLAQLHQLRGRIGRGSAQSTCLLLYQGPLGETARRRLGVMRDTDDGFLIAEEDLRLRGAGELLGVRQSGMPEFRLADPTVQDGLIAMARDDAALILERDPELESERGQALRVLLYLFERDAAIRYLRSG